MKERAPPQQSNAFSRRERSKKVLFGAAIFSPFDWKELRKPLSSRRRESLWGPIECVRCGERARAITLHVRDGGGDGGGAGVGVGAGVTRTPVEHAKQIERSRRHFPRRPHSLEDPQEPLARRGLDLAIALGSPGAQPVSLDA